MRLLRPAAKASQEPTVPNCSLKLFGGVLDIPGNIGWVWEDTVLLEEGSDAQLLDLPYEPGRVRVPKC